MVQKKLDVLASVSLSSDTFRGTDETMRAEPDVQQTLSSWFGELAEKHKQPDDQQRQESMQPSPPKRSRIDHFYPTAAPR